jgi:hypothetical protein
MVNNQTGRLPFSKFYPETARKMYMDVPIGSGLIQNYMEESVVLNGTGAVTLGDTVTLAHGLANTPTFVALTPLASGSVWLVTSDEAPYGWDSTNIYAATSVASLPFLAKVEV